VLGYFGFLVQICPKSFFDSYSFFSFEIIIKNKKQLHEGNKGNKYIKEKNKIIKKGRAMQ
jgi:hypothetical protein